MANAFLFDFVGTLAHPVADGRPSTYREVLVDAGVAVDDAAFGRWNHRFLGASHRDASGHEDEYEAWLTGAFDDLLERLHVVPSERRTLIAALRAVDDRPLEPDPDALRVLVALRGRGAKLAICANAGWRLGEQVERAGLGGLVDAVVTSAQVGYRKPNPQVFREALGKLVVPARESLVIGGDWGRDVLGATAAGLKAVHLWSPLRNPGNPPPGRPGVPRLESLGDVLTLAPA